MKLNKTSLIVLTMAIALIGAGCSNTTDNNTNTPVNTNTNTEINTPINEDPMEEEPAPGNDDSVVDPLPDADAPATESTPSP